MSAPAIQTKRWTRKEYERMAALGLFSPDERVELLAGEIVTMTPQRSAHAAAIGLTEAVLRQVFGPSNWIRIQLPLIVDPDSEPEPDLAVVGGEPREYVNEHPRTALLVVEIADSTLEKDRALKTPIYARAGIPEYWIVSLAEPCLEIYRDPITRPGQPAHYQSFQKVTRTETISPLSAPHSAITVADLLP
ncbi:Uma2 family endonuclease [Nitrospira sp. Nam80]